MNELLVRFGSKSRELEISGRSVDLIQLADLLHAGDGELPSSTSGAIAPYDTWLDRITVRRIAVSDQATIEVDEIHRTVAVVGGPAALEILSSEVRDMGDPDAVSDAHMHIEYYPGHPFLTKDSVPLVLGRRSNGTG